MCLAELLESDPILREHGFDDVEFEPRFLQHGSDRRLTVHEGQYEGRAADIVRDTSQVAVLREHPADLLEVTPLHSSQEFGPIRPGPRPRCCGCEGRKNRQGE